MATGKTWAQGITCTTYNKGNAWIGLYFEETYDVNSNTSTITLTNVRMNTDYYAGNMEGRYTITIDGQTAFSGHFSGTSVDSGYGINVVVGATYTVPHNEDGTKTISIGYKITDCYNGSYGVGYNQGSASANIALTTIPRNSELDVSNGTLGVAQTLSVERKDTNYTHTIAYTCGDASGIICDKSTAASYQWTPPMELAAQRTDSTAVSISFALSTYNGSTLIGTRTYTISCAIPDSVVPTVTFTVSDLMGYLDVYGDYVQTKSKLKIDAVGVGVYGSTVASYRIEADNKVYNYANVESDVVQGAGELTIKVTVTDTRGRTATATETVNVITYTPPMVTDMTASRCNADGAANKQGDYLLIKWSSITTSLNEINTAAYTVKYKQKSHSVYTSESMGEYTNQLEVSDGTYIIPASAAYTFDVAVVITDDFATIQKEIVAMSGKVFFSRFYRGLGAAFGKVAELEDYLEVAWNLKVKKSAEIEGSFSTNGGLQVGGMTTLGDVSITGVADVMSLTVGGKSLLDIVYPVNSIYISAGSTSPAELFGGTWTQLKDRFLLGAGDIYALGETGGSEKHTLSIDEMPPHNHNFMLWGEEFSGIPYSGSGGGALNFWLGNKNTGQNPWCTIVNKGGGAEHNNMPPYSVVCFWKRIE